MKKQYGIIYKVTNKLNGKVYIGQTIRKLSERRNGHIKDSKSNSNLHFHNALRKYGIKQFVWEIIDTTRSRIELNKKECFYIKEYNSFDKRYGYNMTYGGEGVKPNLVTREKQSKSHIGKSNPMKGKHYSKEIVEKYSKSHKGKPAWNKGIPCRQETKEKLRQANLGKKLSDETKAKQSKALLGRVSGMKGKIHTEEWKVENGKRMKKIWAERRISEIKKVSGL